MDRIPEKDWKMLRSMQSKKLALVCENILAEAEKISKNRKGEEHRSFLHLWDEMSRGNKKIGELFDDTRRSNAILKLIAWKKYGLLSEAELLSFSEETQRALERF